MSVEDTEINAQVRKVFARHLVNLADVTYRTVHKRVHIHGWLEKLPLAGCKMASDCVDTIFREMEKIPGVIQVSVELENWDRVGRGFQLSRKGQDALIHGRPRDHITGGASSTWGLPDPSSAVRKTPAPAEKPSNS